MKDSHGHILALAFKLKSPNLFLFLRRRSFVATLITCSGAHLGLEHVQAERFSQHPQIKEPAHSPNTDPIINHPHIKELRETSIVQGSASSAQRPSLRGAERWTPHIEEPVHSSNTDLIITCDHSESIQSSAHQRTNGDQRSSGFSVQRSAPLLLYPGKEQVPGLDNQSTCTFTQHRVNHNSSSLRTRPGVQRSPPPRFATRYPEP